MTKTKSDKKLYDVCIVGGGPAGLTSAIYSSRYGLKTVLIAKEIGGMMAISGEVENYPGYKGSGMELVKRFEKQAKNFGTEILAGEVTDLKKNKKEFIINLDNDKKIFSKSLILTLGTKKRKLGIPGEEKFIGKGVSYCATCDAAFYKDKKIAIIGGRNSAAKAALILANFAKKVYIVYRRGELRCDEIEKNRIKGNKNIEMIYNSVPTKILGDKFVNGMEIKKDSNTKKIDIDGVFIEIGTLPVTELAKKFGVKVDKEGYIIVDKNMNTNIKGVFAAGDSVNRDLKQTIVAAGQGAIAAYSAKEYLNKN